MVGANCLVGTEELEIVSPVLNLISQEKVKEYDWETKEFKTQDEYLYRGHFGIRNLSGDQLELVTGGLTQELVSSEDSVATVRVAFGGLTLGGDVIIPSLSDLNLVSLNASELALIRIDLKSRSKLTDYQVEYSTSDCYGNRFGYWSGLVRSSASKVGGV